jgi:sarcosine oxidase subunit delta
MLTLGQPTVLRRGNGMSFFLSCPNCGPRDVSEFRYGGEVTPANLPGPQQERWYHRLGCRRWLLAERDVRTNQVLSTRWLTGERA